MSTARPAIVRATIGLIFATAIGAGVALGTLAGSAAPSLKPSPSGSEAAVASGTPVPSGSASPASTDAPSSAAPSPTATPGPTATPAPTPVLVPAPLTGLPVGEAVAQRHVIAVMVDDHWAARPQSGFTDASIVWQAPAEGGIPRYMMLFQDRVTPSVGPVRSARYYYVAWASEWHALYVHVGGSPQAITLLRSQDGRGRVVFDADEFRWGGGNGYLWRTQDRSPPHNVYSDGAHLRKLARRLGATDGPIKRAWRFAADAPLDVRPKGGLLVVPYERNKIVYHYDRASNTYLRTVTDELKQTDAKTGKRVAPKNVVVLTMHFGPLNDGSKKHRLEAEFIGSGKAWIGTNGKTIQGVWKKASLTAPTLLYKADGKTPVTLTAGQTFVQVVEIGTPITVKDGTVPAPPRPNPAGGRPTLHLL